MGEGWRGFRADPPAAGDHLGSGGFAAGSKRVWGWSSQRWENFVIFQNNIFLSIFRPIRYFEAITHRIKAFKIKSKRTK